MPLRGIVGTAVLVAAAVFTNLAVAEPTLHEVYQAAESGNLAQAQRMMNEVLRAHPDSAKAHYVEAELLARQGQLSAAATELSAAERLDPGLPFAKPDAVGELKARIASPRAFAPPTTAGLAPGASGGISWVALLLGATLLAVIVLVIGRMMNRRNAAVAPLAGALPYASNAPSQVPASATPAPTGPVGGGMGSAILGGLATGAAVGAGVVAGEALANRLMGGHHGDSSVQPLGGEVAQSGMGGTDFGVAESSSWDDGGFGGIAGDGGDWS